MRDLFLTLFIPAVILWGLTSGQRAILVLTWICFQRPQDFSWGMWNHLPTFQIALFAALVSTFIHREFRPQAQPVLVIQILLLIWLTLSAAFAFDSTHAWEFYRGYVPSLWAMPIILCATIHDIHFLKKVIWVAAGSIALTGFKSGVVLTLQGGAHLTQQVSGFVGDNNVFGLVLCVVVAIVIGMRRTLPDKRWAHLLFYAVICANVLCIVFTKSRGALLTLGVIAVLASLKSGKFLRYGSLLVVAAILAYAVIPAEYFDRLGTLKEVSADRSAMGRVENWGLAWNEAVRHPLFGVGPDNHIRYNNAMGTDVEVRVAHSVYFQVLGELGFPGLLFYVMFLITSIRSVYRTWRMMVPLVQQHPDLIWVRDVAFWMMFAFIGYAIGAGLLNMLYIEFPWNAMLLGSLLLPLLKRELARRASLPKDEQAVAVAPVPSGQARRPGRRSIATRRA